VIASGITGPGYLNIRKGPWHPIRSDCQDASGRRVWSGVVSSKKCEANRRQPYQKSCGSAAWSIDDQNTLVPQRCKRLTKPNMFRRVHAG
jgi:hypothetical protein